MSYYLQDWYLNLKETGELRDLGIVGEQQNDGKHGEKSGDLSSELDTSVDSSVDDRSNESLDTSGQPVPKPKHKENESPVKAKPVSDQPKISAFFLLRSLCSLIVINCFIVSFLIKYLIKNETFMGLLFMQVSLVIITCNLLYYPSFKLNKAGKINLRLLKWIYFILDMAIFFHLIRNHTQTCSSMILSATVGVKLFREFPFLFPNTFTFNELIILCSMCSSGLFTFLTHLYKISEFESDEVVVVEHSLVWLVIVIILTRKITFLQRSLSAFLINCFVLILIYFVPIIYVLFNENAFLWLLQYIFLHGFKRLYLLTYWLMLFAFMSILTYLQNQLVEPNFESEVVTKIRKIFHFIIMIVYSLGFVYDRELLFLCSYGMLILLILAEIIRYYKIGLTGEIIQQSMSTFLDGKDKKSSLILSHIFLLIGFSFPLWITDMKEFSVAELSGLITVGVGDSFASLIGSKFGRHKYPGSKKSFEGSLALIFSQFLIYLFLNLCSVIRLYHDYNFVLVAANLILSAFVEALTPDNDNLILPIVVYPFLCLIK